MPLRFCNAILAILVLLGSVGFPVSRHFCMGELKSVAIFGEAEKCHQDQKKAYCPFHPVPAQEETETDEKGCCDDEHELLQIDDQEPSSVSPLPRNRCGDSGLSSLTL